MIFQGGLPPDPWSLSDYRSHDILIWVMIIFAAVMAFFLLAQYMNTRKPQHLLWGFALILTFIAFHQVANTGSYVWILTEVGLGFMILIPGLIAAGLLLATFESKPLIGWVYLLCMIIVASGVIIIGLENFHYAIFTGASKDFAPWYPFAESTNFDPDFRWRWLTDNWFRMSITAVASVASLGVMLVIPLYTTLKTKETTSKALLTIVGPILFIAWIIIFLFGMTYIESLVQIINLKNWDVNVITNIVLWWTFGLFPYFFMFSIAFLVLGIHYEPKWTFTIPGVEVEEETRIEKLTVEESKPLISSILGIAGGALLVLGAMLAGIILPSPEIAIGLSVGLLIIIGLLSATIGSAVILGWDLEIRGNKIATYLRIGLGAAALIIVALLMFMPMTVPPTPPPFPPPDPHIPVFLTEEGMWWSYIGVSFLFAGPVLILAGGVLRQFVFKD